MKRPGLLLPGALALAALLPVGCTSASSASSGAQAEAGPDPVGAAIDAVLDDLHAKLSARAAAGWSADLPMSSSAPPRPLLAIRTIMNKTTQSVDVAALQERIARRLAEGGHVIVAATDPEREDAMAERDYDATTSTSPDAAEGPGGDSAGLLLTGELVDDVVEVDGERSHTVMISLTVTDTVKGKPLVMAQGTSTGVSER